MNPTENLRSIGAELGLEGAEHLIARAEVICSCEARRISLINEPRIAALEAEIASLVEQEAELQERLRKAAPPGDEQRRQRRAWYCGAVTFLLSVAGFFLALLAFAPYQVGWYRYLFCAGIAIVTPYIAERFLDEWASQNLVKTLVSAAFLAAMISLSLLAVIRGDLLFEQAKAADANVVIDDTVQTDHSSATDFYRRTRVPLQIVMALLAVAMEIGAGVALREALKLGAGSGESYMELSKKIDNVRAQMGVRLEELIRLKNEPAKFAARFWRDFHYSLLTRATRDAMKKLFIVAAAALLLFSPFASATNDRQFVIAVDLTKSVAVKGPDGETEFKKNLDGVTHLLAQLPADSSVAIIGITNRSFAQPLMLLRAHVPGDPGYFGERLQSARNQIVRAWKEKSAHLEPHFEYTDVLGSLLLASEIFGAEPASQKTLVIFSDMRHHTRQLDLESPSKPLLLTTKRIHDAALPVAKLTGVQVYALGVDGAARDYDYWNALQGFWQEYFSCADAHLAAYSILREHPLD